MIAMASLAVAIRMRRHDPPPRDAGTLRLAARSLCGRRRPLNVTVMSNL